MLSAMLYDVEDIRIVDLPIPEIGPDEVLVRNRISTTCGTDVKNYKRGYPLLKPPHPYGHEFSGVIAAAGRDVRGFREGDRVAVHNTAPCNACYFCKNGLPSMCENLTFCRGSYAEYVRVPAPIVRQNMFVLDDSVTHKTASLMEPFACAVYGIDNCPVRMGDTVVVNGAGPIGLMLARLAVLRGARVIVTDVLANRLALAAKLGVWQTCDLTGAADAVAVVRSLTDGGRGADIVIEATGLIGVWNSSARMARKGGFVLLFGGTRSGSMLEVDATLMHYSQITLKGVFHTTPQHVLTALELLKMGVISSDDFIQHEYRLPELEQAIREHAAGGVIKNCIVYAN